MRGDNILPTAWLPTVRCKDNVWPTVELTLGTRFVFRVGGNDALDFEAAVLGEAFALLLMWIAGR